ncbi:hypothetical protein WA158_002660 [Blastocystis sp. Blastoise]
MESSLLQDEQNKEKTSFPYFKMMIMMFISFCNGLFTTFPTPMIPFMIKRFFPDILDSDVGYYAGYLTSFTFLAQIPGLFAWGWLADKCGRKYAITLCFLGVSSGILMFGFSQTYTIAIIGRMLWGFFDGTWSLMKTITSEFCGNDNIAMCLSLLTTGYGIGTITGPFVGAFFSNPASNLPFLMNIFPETVKYSFLWPCLFVVFCIIISILLFLCFIPETLTKERIEEINQLKMTKEQSFMHIEERRSFNTEDNLRIAYKDDNYITLLRNKEVLVTAMLYGLLSLVQTTHDVLTSLLLLNPREKHGFSMDSEQMGYIYMTTAILRSIAPLNSCPPDFRAKANSIQEILGGLGKFIGPCIGTPLFAWSCSNGLSFPFDYGFTYYLLGIICLFTGMLPNVLNKSINEPKEELRITCKTTYKKTKSFIQTQSDLDQSDIAIVTDYVDSMIKKLPTKY